MNPSGYPAAPLAPRRSLVVTPGLIGVVWGAAIGCIPLINFFFRPNYVFTGLYDARDVSVVIISVLSTLALLAGLGVSFLAALALGVDYRRQSLGAALFFALLLSAVVSGLPANAPAMPLLLVTMAAGFVMDINFGALDQYQQVFRSFAVTATVLFILGDLLALFSRDFTWGRLGGHAGPNFWGLVSGSALMLCLLMRPAWLRVLVVAVACLTLYLGQARGSMVGTAIGASLIGMVKLARMPGRRATFWAIAGATGVIVLLLFFGDAIANKLLLVNDASRGAGSKGSGRLLVWSELLQLIGAHPLIGLGLHGFEQYLHATAAAHNAYLSTTAEQGLIGLALYLILMIGGLVRAIGKALRDPTGLYLAVVGYFGFFLGIGLFEANSLQTGNSFSLIVLICAALAWRVEPETPPPVLASSHPGFPATPRQEGRS